jgi:hypothetical protein
LERIQRLESRANPAEAPKLRHPIHGRDGVQFYADDPHGNPPGSPAPTLTPSQIIEVVIAVTMRILGHHVPDPPRIEWAIRRSVLESFGHSVPEASRLAAEQLRTSRAKQAAVVRAFMARLPGRVAAMEQGD